MTEKRILEIISDLTVRRGITVKELQLAKLVAEVVVNEALDEAASFLQDEETAKSKILNLRVI